MLYNWPMPSWIPTLLSVLMAAAAFGCLIAAFYAFRRKRLIDDLPTSKTQGVFIGLAELKGTAESETPLTSHLAGALCVHYDWKVEEHWSRTVTETYTDGKGRSHTRTRTQTGWTRVAGGGEAIPFYLEDDTGVIRIVPEGARIQGVETFNRTCSPNDSLYFGKAPAREIANSTHRRRFRETALPLHSMLYVMGQARERQDVAAAEIAHDRKSPMFLISVHTEKQVSSRYALWSLLWVALGIATAMGGAVLWSQPWAYQVPVEPTPYIVAGSGFVVALALGWVWTVYNSLIVLHHRTEQGWSQVDVQLKRRHDLIPNLVKAVEGYRLHESEVQALLAELRAQAEATPPGVAGADFKGIVPVLRATVERYPDLKAGESFLRLQQALVDAEQRIALARDYFNDIATTYNTRLGIIPDRFVAALARLRPQTLMGAADFERAPVEVKLVS